MSEVMKFSVVLKEIPVILVGEEGTDTNYTLREMVGRTRDEFMNRFRDKAKFDGEGKIIGITTFDGSQSSLLSACLFDEDDNPVKEEFIQELPTTVLGKLFNMAQELSGLLDDEKTKEQSKNDSEGSDSTGSE